MADMLEKPGRAIAWAGQANSRKRDRMGCVLAVAIILLILWLLGLLVFNLGVLIHIALVLAVILIIVWLLRTIFRLI
jgi:Flp pilus assembly protein TadB